jgi:trk system potassium uptake protein TrkH
MIAVAALSAAAVVTVEAARPGGVGAAHAAMTAVSAQTTTGFSATGMENFAPASVLLLILVMLIGGSMGATAGGVKVFRACVIAGAARHVLARARATPHAVTHLRVFGRKAGRQEAAEIMGLCALYAACLAVLWLWMCLEGAGVTAALFDAVSTLSTVGLSMGAIGPDSPDRLKLAVCAGMLLGRVEFIAALLVVRPATWIG